MTRAAGRIASGGAQGGLIGRVRERAAKLLAGGDIELAEHLARITGKARLVNPRREPRLDFDDMCPDEADMSALARAHDDRTVGACAPLVAGIGDAGVYLTDEVFRYRVAGVAPAVGGRTAPAFVRSSGDRRTARIHAAGRSRRP